MTMQTSAIHAALGKKASKLLASLAAFGLVLGVGASSAVAAPSIRTNLEGELAGGQETYGTSVQARPGETVNLKVYLENDGTSAGTNTRITEDLGQYLTYTPNSSYVKVKENNLDVYHDLTDSLIKVENNGHRVTWAFQDMDNRPSAAMYLQFKAVLAPNSSFSIGKTVVSTYATAAFDGASATTNKVNVTVTRDTAPVVTLSARTEVRNATLGDPRFYDDFLGITGAGDTLQYRITVLNSGNTAASNVKVKAVLPAGFTYAGNAKVVTQDNQNGTAISGDALVKDGYLIPSLENGSAAYREIYFDVKAPATCVAKEYTVYAQAILNGAVKSNDDGATVNLSCTRGLVIDKTVYNPATGQFGEQVSAKAGDIVTFRINVQNNGTTTVENPMVRDLLPSDLEYVKDSLTIDTEVMNQTLQDAFFKDGILLTTLTPGHTKQLEIKFKVTKCLPQQKTVVNTAYAKGTNIAEVSDTASVIVPMCGATPTPTPSGKPTPTPSGKPTPTPTPTTPGTLPETGPEDAIALIGAVSGIGATAGRYLQLRGKLKKSASNIEIL